MLLTELKKVIEIDGRISNLHQELSSLYEQRALYVQPSTQTASQPQEGVAVRKTSEDWAEVKYSELSRAWAKHHIALPKKAVLKKRLRKARDIITALETIEPEFISRLEILLVPPAKELGYPTISSLRSSQSFVTIGDFVNAELPGKFTANDWRLFVVYNGATALEMGSAKDILASGKYMLGGYDGRGLGFMEHFALTLQLNKALEPGRWTSLLRNCTKTTARVPSVTFYNGQYRYELDAAEGVFGDELFRPAVEVQD